MQSDADEAALLREIREACRRGEARAARNALSRWVRKFGPRSAAGSLMTLAAGPASPELAAALRELDASRFSPRGGDPWQGQDLWRAFEAWRSSGHTAPTSDRDDFDLYAAARKVR